MEERKISASTAGKGSGKKRPGLELEQLVYRRIIDPS